MKSGSKKFMDKLQAVVRAWGELASEESFGGMTLAEFKAEAGKSETPRARLEELENQMVSVMQERDAADEANKKKVQLIVNSAAGHPKFGEDSALYEAMGYTPTSKRKTGLTRKSKADIK